MLILFRRALEAADISNEEESVESNHLNFRLGRRGRVWGGGRAKVP